MRKKIKICDKVYCVSRYNNLEIEEKEITDILEDNKYYLYDEDFTNNQNLVVYDKERDFFVEDGWKIYFRTKKKVIQKNIEEIEFEIQSLQGSILEHKELLKELNKLEKEND